MGLYLNACVWSVRFLRSDHLHMYLLIILHTQLFEHFPRPESENSVMQSAARIEPSNGYVGPASFPEAGGQLEYIV